MKIGYRGGPAGAHGRYRIICDYGSHVHYLRKKLPMMVLAVVNSVDTLENHLCANAVVEPLKGFYNRYAKEQ